MPYSSLKKKKIQERIFYRYEFNGTIFSQKKKKKIEHKKVRENKRKLNFCSKKIVTKKLLQSA